MNKKCQCYVGSDFIGREIDYKAIKQGLNTNPRPSWLQEIIKIRGEIQIDDVKPCSNIGTQQLKAGTEKLWMCRECSARVMKYVRKFTL